MTSTNTQTKQYDGDKPDFCTVTGKSMYARVFEPAKENEEYNIPARWTIDVLVNAETSATLKARGISVKDTNDKYKVVCESQGWNADGYNGDFITVKKPTIRKVWDKDLQAVKKDSEGKPVTEAAPRPRVVDSTGTEIPDEANLLVGNGSDVQVSFVVTKPMIGGREQFGKFGGRLFETKILDLVEYTPNNTGTFVFAEDTNSDSPAPEATTAGDSVELNEDEIPFLPETEQS